VTNVTLTFVDNLQVGTLTVIKVLNNNSGGSKTLVTEFSFTRNGVNEVAFEADGSNQYTYPAGTEIDVAENDYSPDYVTTYSDDYAGNGTDAATECQDLVIPNAANVTCTITNDDTQKIPVAKTTQTWTIKDTLTLDGLRTGASNAGTATVTFALYEGGTCTAATKVGQEVVTGVTGETVAMTAGIPVTATGYYSWIVTYSGDLYNEEVVLECGDEQTLIQAKDWNRDTLPQG